MRVGRRRVTGGGGGFFIPLRIFWPCMVTLAVLATPATLSATTFTVNTTDDVSDGTCNVAHCSLREALAAARTASGPHTIAFDIPGAGVRTIATGSTCLPMINTQVTIDGYTQPGSSPNTNATGAINAVPLIEVVGSTCSRLETEDWHGELTVRGLVLSGPGTKVGAFTGGTLRVEGCFIGTTADGMAAALPLSGTWGYGVTPNAGPAVVGGLTPAARNVISGNRVGIRVGDSTTTIVQGNLIGTNKLGTAPVPNENGFVSGGCNSGNATLQIGGATPEARNVVSGNVETGVSVGGRGAGCGAYTSVNSFIKGNYIGTDVTGTQPLGNGKGVNIDAGPDLYVGGAAAGEGNVIAFNSGAGITAYQGGVIHGIRILGNRIFGNGAMGIDLLHSGGVTPNDAGDTDEFHQNFPVITGVLASGGNTTVTGTLNSEAGKTYRLEFFASDAADATSHGEGQSYLGTTDVTTDGGGDASFSVVLPATVTSAQFVTATATDPDGNTSEFSKLEADLSVTHLDAPDPVGTTQDVTHTLTVTNAETSVFPSGAVTLTYTKAADATVVDSGGGTAAGSTVTFNLGVIPIGAVATRTVVVRYASAGAKASTAAIASVVIDPVTANNTASATTTVTATPPPVQITGTVTRLGAPLAGVTLMLSGSATATTTSAVNGTYSFQGLSTGGGYTVTPQMTGHVFTPAARSFSSMTSSQVADFLAQRVYRISGQVRDLNDTGVAGVTVTLSGAQGSTVTTDPGGTYVFPALIAGGTYTVTPAKGSFAFTPASQTFPNLQQDEVAAFFVAQVGIFTRYFAEGATSTFFDTEIALLNATGQPTTATVRFQRPAGAPEVTQTVTLAGIQRVTLDPKSLGLTAAEFSTVVESTQPVIADRTMTWEASGYGSHAETSIGRPLTRWYLAEGATINGFDLFYLIQNPTTSTAQIDVQYLLPAPLAPVTKSYAVAPQSRFNIWVNQEGDPLGAAEVSAVITSTNGVPVIVERAMYRPVGAQIFGAGHESAGVEAPAEHWYFAEGATGPYFDLFFLVANPNAQASLLEARFLKPDGSVVTKTYTIDPNSRFNVWVDFEGAELADTAVATTFRVTNGVNVVIERAMWWWGDIADWYEGHNSAGATASGEKWGLAAGEVGGPTGLETYILIANTSNTAGTARVTLTFEDGAQATRDFVLPANSRSNVAVATDFPAAANRRFGAIVESLGAPAAQIVVERAMYNNAGGVFWAAGTSALATKLR